MGFSNGDRVVVVASYGKSHVLDLSTNTWSAGPNHQYRYAGQGVPYGDTFVVVGGYGTDGQKTFRIEMYQPDAGTFTTLSAKMSQAANYHVVISIPDDLVQC